MGLIETCAHGVEVPKPVKPAPVTERNFVALDDEAISKIHVVWVVDTLMARLAKGVEVPRPRRPREESQINWVPFAFPKRTVDEALNRARRERMVEVALVLTPKFVVGVKGKAVETVAQATVPDELVVSA